MKIGEDDREILSALLTNAYITLSDLYEDEELADISEDFASSPDELKDYSIKLSVSVSTKLDRDFFDIYISLAEMDELRLFAFSEPMEKYETAEEALNSFCDILGYNSEIIDEMLEKVIYLKDLDEEA